MRHQFVLSILLLLPTVRAVVGPKNGSEIRPKNDDDVSINSLDDVDLSCDGGRCEPDGQGGVPSTSWTTTKKPNIFQLDNKSCPGFELPPVFPRQHCDTDRDCWPRICCGYGGLNGQKYCRIPLPSWRNDLMKTITKSLRSSRPRYLQCSPPPPKRYDLFPRKCRTTVDCLPDLCCPEIGRNVCRPPKEIIQPIKVRLSIG
ncbi:PREDICTED: uncharacterized protein LOC107166740 isoform X1 [Diuraphis noxia]|uniref:uncharacterized protein LOC107166740 isoform X1 n=1 Tax=Diuraphis noxia TaxID=143948 RepID=UPI00076370F4|nr:PREDICTED: uncharacterized protein LOC107166740 isoform X1 [Diuraphis noxia]